MNHVAATEAAVIMSLLIGLMGAWDGLIRRHIRLGIEVIQVRFNVRGTPAMGLGALSLLLAALLARLAIQHTESAATACRADLRCMAGRVLLPPFTAWPSACMTLVSVIAFAYWASGASELAGPYRRHMLAPGVWDTDKQILALVSGRLRAQDRPPVNDDTVVELASWVRQRLSFFAWAARDVVTRDNHLDAASLTLVLLSTPSVRRFKLSEHALPVVLATIAEYYEEKYEQAARVWPWRRRVVPY